MGRKLHWDKKMTSNGNLNPQEQMKRTIDTKQKKLT